MHYTPDPAQHDDAWLQTGPAAGLWPRAGARLIDFVLLAVVNAVVVGVLVVGSLFGRSGGMLFGTGVSSVGASAIGALLGAGINLAYFAVLASSQ
jgi:uncharacterized RDD family membrane protein YckC